jgi:hypothetical protein
MHKFTANGNKILAGQLAGFLKKDFQSFYQGKE